MIFIEPHKITAFLAEHSDMQIIDIRTTKNFNTTHFEGAISIPRDEFAQHMNLIEKQKPIFVYCHYGLKSDEIGLFLEKKFKTTVYVLEGGWKAYEESIE